VAVTQKLLEKISCSTCVKSLVETKRNTFYCIFAIFCLKYLANKECTEICKTLGSSFIEYVKLTLRADKCELYLVHRYAEENLSRFHAKLVIFVELSPPKETHVHSYSIRHICNS
jgi:hypothetical protein